MASAVNHMSSLPAKKRKASNASSTTTTHREGGTVGSNATTTTRDMSRLPSKKRKGSHDYSAKFAVAGIPTLAASSATDHDASSLLLQRLPHKESVDSTFLLDTSIASSRKLSDTSSGLKTLEELFHSPKNQDVSYHGGGGSNAHHLPSLPTSALDHLDALEPAAAAASAKEVEVNPELPPTAAAATGNHAAIANSTKRKDSVDDNSSSATIASSGQRLLLEAIMMASQSDSQCGNDHRLSSHYMSARRDRLESWGGMSDISMPHADSAMLHNQQHLSHHQTGSTSSHAQHRPHYSAINHPSDRGGFALTLDEEHDTQHPEAAATSAGSIPSRIALTRDREFSIASLSEVSAFNIPLFTDGEFAVSGAELQAYVAAAVASMGDQLAELAGAVESAAGPDSENEDMNVAINHRAEHEDDEAATESSSVVSNLMMIGATSDAHRRGRLRSWSTGSGMISVDLDAVQAAVDAAQAASAGINLADISSSASIAQADAAAMSVQSRHSTERSRIRNTQRKLPLKRSRAESAVQQSTSVQNFMQGASLSEREIDDIRERTRANLHASSNPAHDPSAQPLKKRGRRKTSLPDVAPLSVSLCHATPKISNRNKRNQYDEEEDMLPIAVHSTNDVASTNNQKGSSAKNGSAADLKWDEMYNCLLEFAEERRTEGICNLTPEQAASWVWDGHVPTNYKRGEKALGRWVNNQRSSKAKGTLKEDREDRLVAAGLKWSVVTSNQWDEMFEELRIYIAEQKAQNSKWNGNVPASYQIKRTNKKVKEGEDLLLGRWVNRQRSLYQAGRLKKDRQVKLEQIGLRWSMLLIVSWESMFESLQQFVAECTKDGNPWDGNVSTHYRTTDDPPRALGRWINRQRSAYAKKKLKQEYVDKLNELGLKWSVHERLNDNDYHDDDSVCEIDTEEV
ncbi:hypothetical protein MPSEU_000570500 [Mayamaea pseudoterrestris]|nr:hypothetical protein MPSEU_000570500 [Mayamaea pseudoterrestris]